MKNLHTEKNQCVYNKCKRELEETFDNFEEDFAIRSWCQWHEGGEKSNKSCVQIQIHKFFINVTELNDHGKTQNEIKIKFYESLLEKGDSKTSSQRNFHSFPDKVKLYQK